MVRSPAYVACILAIVVIVAIIGIIGFPSSARADSPKVAEARQAIDEVRYDDARRLLVDAIDAGGNSPAAVRQIYELSASTAIVLGQPDLGEQYYRRWLAIEPGAKLPAGSSPKLTEAFVAAQSYMAAHGRLVVTASRSSVAVLTVVVTADPLSMAAAAGFDGSGERVSFGANHAAELDANVEAMRVVVLDDHGNQLLAIDVPAATVLSVPDHRTGRLLEDSPRPFLRQWTTWAVPAGGFLVAGGILGVLAITEQDKLDMLVRDSGSHFFSEVDGQHDKIRRHATIAIGLGAVGVVLGIPAAVFYVRAQKPWTIGSLRNGQLTVAPVVGPGGLGVAGAF